MRKTQVRSMFGADVLWKKGYTGIRADHPHFRNIKAGIDAVSNFQERTNWANEDTLSLVLLLVEIQNAFVLLRTRRSMLSECSQMPSFPLLDSSESGATQNLLQTGSSKEEPAVLGLLEIGDGRVGVYGGDSNCLDSSHMVTNCHWLLKKMLDLTISNTKDLVVPFSKFSKRYSPVATDENQLPSRRTDVNFSTYSSVIGKELICLSDSRFEVWGDLRNTRPARWRSAKDEGELSSSRSKNRGGLFNRDEIDMSFLVATRWIVPPGVAASGSLTRRGYMEESDKRGVGGEGHLGLID
ncbi:hypothetical protein Bca4012_045719 [Brassica carinata]